MDHIIDAKNKYLGRLSTEIAAILQGKHNVNYDPKVLGSDRVIIKNVRDIKVSGKKETGKLYHRHTGYMGHLKTLTYSEVKAKNPANVLRHAVRGMLPKNFLKDKRLNRLIIEK